jgi:hypothetical protein
MGGFAMDWITLRNFIGIWAIIVPVCLIKTSPIFSQPAGLGYQPQPSPITTSPIGSGIQPAFSQSFPLPAGQITGANPTTSVAGLTNGTYLVPQTPNGVPQLILTQAEPPPPPPPPGIAPPPAFAQPPGSSPLPAGFNPNQPIAQQGNSTQFWSQASEQLGFSGGSSARKLFQSDHAFDTMISPVSNPFFFEDPRALTEVRPLLLYQALPGGQPITGNMWWYGTQLRLAITEKLSVTIHKLGGIGFDGNLNAAGISEAESSSSFSEFWISPKWTFYRNEKSGTVAAAGVQIETATGSSLYQGTGGLGIAPYASVGQNFWRTSYGSMNTMGVFAYSLAAGGDRSSFFNFGAHLDYDVANWHKFYPFIDLNWFSITGGGSSLPDVKVQGADLINFGSGPSNGMNQVNIAPGMRYKFSEPMQVGVAFEFPLTSVDNSIENFRLNLDFIYRY